MNMGFLTAIFSSIVAKYDENEDSVFDLVIAIIRLVIAIIILVASIIVATTP